jgi:hypothetical protein
MLVREFVGKHRVELSELERRAIAAIAHAHGEVFLGYLTTWRRGAS